MPCINPPILAEGNIPRDPPVSLKINFSPCMRSPTIRNSVAISNPDNVSDRNIQAPQKTNKQVGYLVANSVFIFQNPAAFLRRLFSQSVQIILNIRPYPFSKSKNSWVLENKYGVCDEITN